MSDSVSFARRWGAVLLTVSYITMGIAPLDIAHASQEDLDVESVEEQDSQEEASDVLQASQESGQNLIINGGFESGSLDSWVFQDWPRRGSAKVVKGRNGRHEGSKGLRVKTSKLGAYWSVQLRQSLSFTPQEYTLSFWARSEEARKIIVNAQEEGTWTNLKLWQEPQLTEEWAFYSYTFTPQMSTDHGQLVFNMGDKKGTVWLDDVRLTAVDVPPPPPPVQGTLSVEFDFARRPASVLEGSRGIDLAEFELRAGALAGVTLTKIVFTMLTTAPVAPVHFSNLTLYEGFIYDEEVVPTVNDPNPRSIVSGGTEALTFTFANPLAIPAGGIRIMRLKGDVSFIDTIPSQGEGTVRVGLTDVPGEGRVEAVESSTGLAVTPSYRYLYFEPYIITITSIAHGLLSLSADSSTPIAGLLPANTTGLTVGILDARAQFEDVKLEKIYLSVTDVNSGGPDQFDKIWLTDGTKTIGVVPTSTDAALSPTIVFDISLDPFVITAGGSTLLTFKVDTANVDRNNSSKGSSNEGFQLSVNSIGDVYAIGVSSGERPTVVGAPHFNSFTLYRSVPTVAFSNPVTNVLSSNGRYDLFRLSISAHPTGPVGVYKLTFGVATSTVNVTDFELWDDSYTVGPVATKPAEIGESNPGILEFLIDTDSNGTAQGGEFREIPAGAIRTFTVRGTVSGYQSSGVNGVITTLAGDAAFPSIGMNCAGFALSGNNSCRGIDAGVEDDFIWSDFSYTTMYNTSTATNTAEWTNGYRVQGLPSTTSTAQAI